MVHIQTDRAQLSVIQPFFSFFSLIISFSFFLDDINLHKTQQQKESPSRYNIHIGWDIYTVR